MPYKPQSDDGDVEEERRVLYVALTRAEDTLHLSFAKRSDSQTTYVRRLSDSCSKCVNSATPMRTGHPLQMEGPVHV